MKTMSLKWIPLIAVLAVIAACGGGNNSDQTACTPTGDMVLHSSNTGTTLLSSVMVSALQSAPAFTVPVYVAYTSPPVAAVAAGYPVGGTDPRTVGMNIVTVGSATANPLVFDLSFDSGNLATATYSATWRFVAFDMNAGLVGCRDLPVTFTVR